MPSTAKCAATGKISALSIAGGDFVKIDIIPVGGADGSAVSAEEAVDEHPWFRRRC